MRIHCLLAVVEEVILDHFISVRHIRCVRESAECSLRNIWRQRMEGFWSNKDADIL